MINKYFLAKMNIPAYLKKFLYVNSESEHEELPDGYTQVEYLESTGTQYIDTNFIPNQDTRIKVKIMTKDISGMTNKTVFGSRESANSKNYSVTMGNGSQNSWWTGYGTSNIATSSSALRDTIYEIEKNKNVTILNGSVLATNQFQTFTCSNNLYLFCMNQSGPTFYSNIELYYCKIWNGNKLIRNFIPCINSSNVAGMYDTVNDVFYTNAGSGTFNAGPVISNLPSGYTQVEYLESTGTQYIDTGVNLSNNSNVEINAKLVATQRSKTYYLFGSSVENKRYMIAVSSFYNSYIVDFANSSNRITSSVSAFDGEFHTHELKNLSYYIDGILQGSKSSLTFTNTSSAYMFEVRDRSTSTIGIQSWKIKYCKIWNGNKLIRNFIPCINSSNVAGMYDTVNKVFYTNAGAGTFKVGPIVN